MEEEKENKNSKADRRRKRMFPLKSVHNTLNNSRVKNNTMNNSLMKSTLRTNNRALAKALQQKRADLQQCQNDVVLLQQENQMLLERVTTLDKVAGLKDQDIDAEVNRRLLKRLNDMMASLHSTCDSVMSFLSMFTETVHSCQFNSGSRNSSLGSERSSMSSREKISISVLSPSAISHPGATIEVDKTLETDRMQLEDPELQLTPELAEKINDAPDSKKANAQEVSSQQPYQLHDLSVITEQSMIDACSRNDGRVFSVTGPRRILVDSVPGSQSEGFKGNHVTKRAKRSKSLRSSGKGLIAEDSVQEMSLQDETTTDDKSAVDETPQKIDFDCADQRQEAAVEDVQVKTTQHAETKDEQGKESGIPEHLSSVKDDAVPDETSKNSPKIKVRRSKHRRTRLISGSQNLQPTVVEPNIASDTEEPSCVLTSDNDQLSTKAKGIADSDVVNENCGESRSSRVTRSKRRDTYCVPVKPPVIEKNATEHVLPNHKSSKLPKPKVKVPSKEITHKQPVEGHRKTFAVKQHSEVEALEQIDLQSMSILVDDFESESLDVDIDIVEPTPRKSESETLSLHIKRNAKLNKPVDAKNGEVRRETLSDIQSKSSDKTKEHGEGMPVVSIKTEDLTMYNVEDMELTAVLPVVICSFLPSQLPTETTAEQSSSKPGQVDLAPENVYGTSSDGGPVKKILETECSNAVVKKQSVLTHLMAGKVLDQNKDRKASVEKSGETEANACVSDVNCSNNNIEVDNSDKDHIKVSQQHDTPEEKNVVEMTKNEEVLKLNTMGEKRHKTKNKKSRKVSLQHDVNDEKTAVEMTKNEEVLNFNTMGETRHKTKNIKSRKFSKPGLVKTRDDKPVSNKMKSSKKVVKVASLSSDGSQSDTEPAKKKSVHAFLSHPGKYWFSCGEPNQLKKSKGKSTLPVCQPKPRSRSKQRQFPSYDFPAEPSKSPSEKTVFDLSMGMNESVTVLPQTKYGDFRERKYVEKDLRKGSEDETVDSTHGIMLVLANGKRTKPRMNKNVRYSRHAADIVTITPPPTSTNDERPNEYVAYAGNTPKRPPKELQQKFDREVVQDILISPSCQINAQTRKNSFDNNAEHAPDLPIDDTETGLVSQNNLSKEKSLSVKTNGVLLEKNDNSEQLAKVKTSGQQGTKDLIDRLNEVVDESGAGSGKESITVIKQSDLDSVNELDSPLLKARSRRRTKKVQPLRDESESDEEFVCQTNKTKRKKSLNKPEKRETKSNIEPGSSESTSRSQCRSPTGESHGVPESQTCSPEKRKLSTNVESIEVGPVKRSRRGASVISYAEPSLGSKLRRGDKCTSTIYSGRNAKLMIDGGKKKTGKSTKGVRESGMKTNLFELE